MTRPAILVVEDDRDLCELVSWVLDQAGYDVRSAANGAEALAILQTFAPVVILLDMRMPVMDGWRFAAELRERGPHPTIVVMTAAEDAGAHAAEIGTPHWIAKPFDIDALLECVGALAPPERAA